MRIEMLSTVKYDTPSGFEFIKEETREVDEKTGRLFCAKGWARDLDGNVPTGARSTEPVDLEVHDARQGQGSEIG